MHQHPTKKWLSSFGRRHGRKLTDERQRLFDSGLPEHVVALPKDGAQIDVAALFDDQREIRLEIGFGAGEHLACLAAQSPEIGFIGCEPFINGVANLLKEMEEQHINNIRIHADDARLLIEKLPPEIISKIYILFPDPWPKSKHHKRRIISKPMLAMLSRIQPSGGLLQLATDHENYGTWMLEHILASSDYEWLAKSQADWTTPPDDWVPTRYQQKTMKEGRIPLFINCRKR